MRVEEYIADIARKYDSFYVYEEAGIIAQAEKLQSSFPGIDFLYSMKCNPNREVLQCVFRQGFGADAASKGEVFLAEQLGLGREQIYFSAPGKSQQDIEETIDKAVIIADSTDEIRRIEAATEGRLGHVKIGIRINPDFSFSGGTGTASKFGIDEEEAIAWLKNHKSRNVKITGIHIHLRSQELNGALLEQYYKKILDLAERFQENTGICLEYINMGSGLGIPYSDKDQPLDIESLGKITAEEIGRFKERYPGIRMFIESGRYVVGKSGRYVTKVLDRKISHGKTYIIVKNTLNGFLRPSIARLVTQYAGNGPIEAREPLFTDLDAFQISALKEDPSMEEVTIVGNLCTAADVIAENIRMPRLEVGDILMISNAGAYGASLSPMEFSSQEKPVEIFMRRD